MADEQGGFRQEEAVESVLAEVGPRLAGLPAPGPAAPSGEVVFQVEQARPVVDVPASRMTQAQATAVAATLRQQYEADPSLWRGRRIRGEIHRGRVAGGRPCL